MRLGPRAVRLAFSIRRICVCSALISAAALAQSDTATITVHAAAVLDGRGAISRNAMITVRAGKIVSVAPAKTGERATYELGTAMVMPGIIDAHVHPGWYINKQGALHNAPNGRDGETPAMSAMAQAGNLYATLMGGVTTIQSLGGAEDLDLRDAVERGVIPGPRILTSITQLSSTRPSPDSLRGMVRALKARGADVIKLFASSGLGAGGQQTLSDSQLVAICSEAKAQGLRTVVHAISAISVRAATLAGCTEIEHGTFATDAELKLMAAHGTIFDPQVCLVFQNYIDHRDVYSKSGYTPETFDALANAIPTATAMFKRALVTPNLKIIFGTDAVALAHGRNVEELVCRVRGGGQKPIDALTSAMSATASALGLGDHVGTIAAGMDADIIAVAGDPTKEIEAMRNVVFVMRRGVVYKARGAQSK